MKITQLFLRFAIAIGFLSAVADRMGLWGTPGTTNVAWGNWENFLNYSNQLNFFVPNFIGGILAVLATCLEVVLAFLLIVGYQTRITAILSGGLLTLFALMMTLAFGIKMTFDYSVWIVVSASFLLSTVPVYACSLDQILLDRRD